MPASLSTVAVLTLSAAVGCAMTSTQPSISDGHGRELTAAEQIQLGQAEQLLIKKCMSQHGFPYWIAPALSVEESRSFGYIMDDVAWARKHGYGSRIQAKVLERKKNDPNIAYRKTLSQARLIQYVSALGGGPDTPTLSVKLPSGGTISSAVGGCEGEAREQLYGDRKTWFRVDKITGNLTPLYVPDLVRDKRFTTALTAWCQCMRWAGHYYTNPDEIRTKLHRLTKGLSSAEAYAIEVRLAVAEATCAQRSKLADTGRELERHYRDKLRDTYGDELATHRRLQLAALARAKDITESQT